MSEEILPIDIDSIKIIEWLLERKKLPNDWIKKLKAATLKMNKLMEVSINNKEIDEYIQKNKNNFTYFEIEEVCQKLLQSDEAKQKGFFGNYQSKAINDWLAFKQFFQKNNLHIASLAKTMNQNLNFEIPGLFKSLGLFEQQLQDNYSKQQDYKNSIKLAEKDFQTNCEKLNIKGDNLEKEVSELILTLPNVFQEFMKAFQNQQTKDILKYYYDFTMYNNSKSNEEGVKLKILEYLLTHNDDIIEIYQLRQNKQVVNEELQKINNQRYDYYKNLIKKNKNQLQSQFDVADQKQNIPVQVDEIKWDFEITNSGQEQQKEQNDEIIWDDDIQIQPAAIQQNDNQIVNGSEEIQWEIIDTTNLVQIEDQDKEADDTIIVDQGFHDTMLSTRETRNNILSSLTELNYFLLQRRFETQNFSGNAILQAYDPSVQSNLFEFSIDQISKMITHIENLINLISNYQTRNLLTLKEQPKAQDRIVHHLQIFLNIIQKNKQQIVASEKKVEEIQKLINESKQKYRSYINSTLQLKGFIQKLLKEQIKHNINLVGEINKIK